MITENFNIIVDIYTNNVLEADKIKFNYISKNALINNIVFYYLKIETNIIEKRLYEAIRRLKVKIKIEDFDKIVQELRKDDNKKIEKTVKLNFRLNKETFKEYTDYFEENNHKLLNITMFFREIFQWYCSKKRYEREAIVCFRELDIINEQISPENFKKKILKLKIKNSIKTEKKVIPLGILTSNNEDFSYLLCYTNMLDEIDLQEVNNFQISLIKISNILEIKLGKKYKIVEDNEIENESIYILKKSTLKKASNILEKGIESFTKEENIKLLLTKKGKKKLETDIYNRPFRIDKIKAKEKNGEYIYEFKSTYLAVKNYFFNFGKECRILCPIELSEEFKNGYNDAFESYLEV